MKPNTAMLGIGKERQYLPVETMHRLGRMTTRVPISLQAEGTPVVCGMDTISTTIEFVSHGGITETLNHEICLY